jgi:hypothetical protein
MVMVLGMAMMVAMATIKMMLMAMLMMPVAATGTGAVGVEWMHGRQIMVAVGWEMLVTQVSVPQEGPWVATATTPGDVAAAAAK